MPVALPCRNSLRPLRIVCWLAFAIALAGCADYPHTRGEWQGVTIPIRVFDIRGNAFDAVGLRIVSGPPVSRFGNGSVITGPALIRSVTSDPLLVHNEDRIMEPGQLRIGASIAVRGDLSDRAAYAPGGGQPVLRVYDGKGRTGPERSIRVKGKVTIIEPAP